MVLFGSIKLKEPPSKDTNSTTGWQFNSSIDRLLETRSFFFVPNLWLARAREPCRTWFICAHAGTHVWEAVLLAPRKNDFSPIAMKQIDVCCAAQRSHFVVCPPNARPLGAPSLWNKAP